jgi:predicted metal-binding protein
MRKILLASSLLALSACGASPATLVFNAKTALDGATLTAVHYATDLPRCSPTQAPPCSRQDLIDKANVSAHLAADVIQRAEDLVRQQQKAKENPLLTAPNPDIVEAQARLATAAVAEVVATTKEMQ